MSKESDVYRELQQHLDKLPIGFPATETGVEIRILKQLFTPEEAKAATKLGFDLEPFFNCKKICSHNLNRVPKGVFYLIFQLNII